MICSVFSYWTISTIQLFLKTNFTLRNMLVSFKFAYYIPNTVFVYIIHIHICAHIYIRSTFNWSHSLLPIWKKYHTIYLLNFRWFLFCDNCTVIEKFILRIVRFEICTDNSQDTEHFSYHKDPTSNSSASGNHSSILLACQESHVKKINLNKANEQGNKTKDS